jgi:hypothetical protein
LSGAEAPAVEVRCGHKADLLTTAGLHISAGNDAEVLLTADDNEADIAGGIEHVNATIAAAGCAKADLSALDIFHQGRVMMCAELAACEVGDGEGGAALAIASADACGGLGAEACVDEQGAEHGGVCGRTGGIVGIGVSRKFIPISVTIVVAIGPSLGVQPVGDFDEVRHAITVLVL